MLTMVQPWSWVKKGDDPTYLISIFTPRISKVSADRLVVKISPSHDYLRIGEDPGSNPGRRTTPLFLWIQYAI